MNNNVNLSDTNLSDTNLSDIDLFTNSSISADSSTIIDKNVVYTGYFARMKDYIKYDFNHFIRITAYSPKYLAYANKIIDCKVFSQQQLGKIIDLAPDSSLLLHYKEDGNISHYINEYGSKLKLFDAQEVYNLFKGSILLCFERYGDFCHRNLLTMWLLSYGLPAQEFIIDTVNKNDSNKNESILE